MTEVIAAPNEPYKGAVERAEARLYEKSLLVIEGVVRFNELDDPSSDEPPEAWVEEHGRARAEAMLRHARLGFLTKRDAPIGLQVAMDYAKTERRARAQKDAAPKALNVAVVNMPKISQFYPKISADDEEK